MIVRKEDTSPAIFRRNLISVEGTCHVKYNSFRYDVFIQEGLMAYDSEKEIEELRGGLHTAFIDGSYQSNLAYRPEFISNDYKRGKKVLASIEQELAECDEFCISVAFITQSGITPLLQVLKNLEEKNIPGKILTTDYLMFSDPFALEKLSSLKNIQLKMFCTDSETGGFHTKGYIFKKEELYRIIIGSSNMTLNAITRSREWNTKVVAMKDGALVQDILSEFDLLWNDEQAKEFDEFIEEYRNEYLKNELIKKQQRLARKEAVVELDRYILKPNKMQVAFVGNVMKMRAEHVKRALLISSTGTGKSLASAFALREMKPEKALFLVHREQIARQTIKSYQRVFGSHKDFGLLSGSSKETKAQYLFATMQMMAKPEIYTQFSKAEFDVIVIDEVHHAGAESYQQIMNYFEPQFWLGMTASPDTSNYDIYSIFDNQIAYEIRLQQALEEDLLCPFHYFGITDLEVNGVIFDDNAGVKNFAGLVSDARVTYILEKAEYYGYSGQRVRGLVFCSRKEEAKELSAKFNLRGYRTSVLTGEDNQVRREEVIEQLTNDEGVDKQLDYVFTVDIFNEGIDVPEINQIIMLRPTESPVVFIQQLGRGLRKHQGKEYVVILDFIGNYMNNFMIPIALSGDRTYSKDNIRRYIMEGSRIIPGSSTIHFDEISKKRIFASVDKMSTTKKLLTEKYMVLKNKLGKIPGILEFYEYGEIDPLLFIQYAGSYHSFLQLIDKEYQDELSDKELRIIEFISANIVNGKRPHELIILKFLMRQGKVKKWEVLQAIKEAYEIKESSEAFDSAINVLCGGFINTQGEKKKYANLEILAEQGEYYGRLMSFYQHIQHPVFCGQIKALIELGLRRYQDLYRLNADNTGLALYQKYSRKDVCRLLNWERDDSSTIYGYKIKNGTCPIFVTYEKKEDIASSTRYKDAFVNHKIFSWLTRSRVSEKSTEAQEIIHHKESGLKILLFVKKSDGEGSDFYYMGQAEPVDWKQTTIYNDAGKPLPIMNFQLELEHSVRDDIYDYFSN